MEIRFNRDNCNLVDLDKLPGGSDLFEELTDVLIEALEAPPETQPSKPKEER